MLSILFNFFQGVPLLGHTKGNTKSNRKKIRHHQSELLLQVIFHLELCLQSNGITVPVFGVGGDAELGDRPRSPGAETIDADTRKLAKLTVRDTKTTPKLCNQKGPRLREEPHTSTTPTTTLPDTGLCTEHDVEDWDEDADEWLTGKQACLCGVGDLHASGLCICTRPPVSYTMN